MERVVQKLDFFGTNTGVFGELSEALAVGVKLGQVHHVFINFIKSCFLRSSLEKHVSVATFNCVFVAWSFIVWGALNFLDVTETERLE